MRHGCPKRTGRCSRNGRRLSAPRVLTIRPGAPIDRVLEQSRNGAVVLWCYEQRRIGRGDFRLELVAYLDFAAANTIRRRALFEHRQPEGKPMPDWYLWEQIRLFGYIEQPLRDLQHDMPPEQLPMLARSLFSAVHGIITLGFEKNSA